MKNIYYRIIPSQGTITDEMRATAKKYLKDANEKYPNLNPSWWIGANGFILVRGDRFNQGSMELPIN